MAHNQHKSEVNSTSESEDEIVCVNNLKPAIAAEVFKTRSESEHIHNLYQFAPNEGLTRTLLPLKQTLRNQKSDSEIEL